LVWGFRRDPGRRHGPEPGHPYIPIYAIPDDTALKDLRSGRRTGMTNSARPQTPTQANSRVPANPASTAPGLSEIPATGTTDNADHDTAKGTDTFSAIVDPQGSKEPSSRSTTEPLTISLHRDLIRRVRVIAVSRGTPVSRIITSLLADAVDRELPAVLAELQHPIETKGGDR
jgi:hypothetical protein